MVILSIPRINDGSPDFNLLFNIWDICRDAKTLELNFTRCDFLRPNAVAFLGGMISYIKQNGGTVSLNINSLNPALRKNLEQNGFLYKMGVDISPWEGNSIPYREDRTPDYQKISTYLKEKWIGRGWLSISHELEQAVVGNVLEIYINAFSHSYSPNGVFSCGQNYPNRKELTITVVDFGIGIPQSIRNYFLRIGKTEIISDVQALQLAFKEGFSTIPGPNGMGLKLLKEFIQMNRGRLDIYSHFGHATIDFQGEHYESINRFFMGTIVNISLNVDQKFYQLSKT